MNAQDWMYLLFALLVGGGILYYIVQPAQEKVGLVPTELTLTTITSAKLGEPLSVTLSATPVKKGAVLTLGTSIQNYSHTCDADPCTFTQTLSFPKTGAYTLQARIGTLSKSQTINIFSEAKICIDGTLETACSTPPLRCENAQLVSNCDVCGCPPSQACQNHACTKPLLHFTLENIVTPLTIYAGHDTPLSLDIQNDSNFEADGLYILFIDSYDDSQKKISEKPNQLQLDHLASLKIQGFTITMPFDSSTHYLGARIHDQGTTFDETNLLGKTLELIPITVITDTTPPLPPTDLISTSTSNGYTLSWTASPSPDVVTYVVYQQNAATGGFTTYTVLAHTSETHYDVSAGSGGALAYVIRAQDGAGNESDATNPVVVPGS